MIRGKKALAGDEDKSFALMFVTAVALPPQGIVYYENGFHVHDRISVFISEGILTS